MKRYLIVQIIHDEFILRESTADDAMTLEQVRDWAVAHGFLPESIPEICLQAFSYPSLSPA